VALSVKECTKKNSHFVSQPLEVLTVVVMKSSILWDITSSILLKVDRCFRVTCCRHRQGQRISQARSLPRAFMVVSCLAYSLTLKMEAICYSDTLVNFQRTTQHYIPEDRTLQPLFYSAFLRYEEP
jgi:hypothetical protein